MPQPKFTWKTIIVPVSSLKPYERNPRTITETDFNKLVESLKRFGQFRPILATKDGRVIGGHQRIKAMQKLGWAQCSITYPTPELSQEQFQELLIRDNVNNGAWDYDILAADFEPADLQDWGVGVDWGQDNQTLKENQEIDTNNFSDKVEMKLIFTLDDFQKVQLKLEQIAQTKEEAIKKLLNI